MQMAATFQVPTGFQGASGFQVPIGMGSKEHRSPLASISVRNNSDPIRVRNKVSPARAREVSPVPSPATSTASSTPLIRSLLESRNEELFPDDQSAGENAQLEAKIAGTTTQPVALG